MKAYQYFLVSLVPDPVRNEQVNIGVIGIFGDKVTPMFLKNPQKIKAISPDYDVSRYDGEGLVKLLKVTEPGKRADMLASMGDDFVRIYPPATGQAKSHADFEMELSKVFDRLVKPVGVRRTRGKVTRLKTMLKKQFQKEGYLGEQIDDKKVVLDFVIAESEDLVADFAYRNGSLNIIETIDFNVSIPTLNSKFNEAGLAAIKIVTARKKIDPDAKGILLYYPPANDGAKIAHHQSLIEDYYDSIVNYADSSQVSAFHEHVGKDLKELLM